MASGTSRRGCATTSAGSSTTAPGSCVRVAVRSRTRRSGTTASTRSRGKSTPILAALSARYPGYVDESAMLYTGFSLGAILGAALVAREPGRFPRAVLIEGGEDKWTAERAQHFARGGGQRVLFACGLRGRVAGANRAAALLERAGAGARVVLGKLPGKSEFIHWYNGPIADETAAALPWLLEGDPRWESGER